ncbi:MAG: PilZ domain-containing protein [Gammaproteobacteria bacterium]|nr:PilZ domain-containing protein [Gammaproteobacteria bacterium]NNM01932.1 PilZ domain-containing protein [Gammaproteobacteria bacterium]
MLIDAVGANRRRQYRVRPGRDDLQIAVVRDQQRHVADEVADVTIKGISLRFIEHAGPELHDGDSVVLSVASPELDGEADIPARIVGIGADDTPDGNHPLVRLQFDATGSLVDRAREEFYAMFNRRARMRGVQPDNDSEVLARIIPDAIEERNREFDVVIRNISTMGACVGVNEATETFLGENSEFAFGLKLPGATRMDIIAARVCYVVLEDDRKYFGCAFDWEQTPNALKMIDRLNTYIMDRFEVTQEQRLPH